MMQLGSVVLKSEHGGGYNIQIIYVSPSSKQWLSEEKGNEFCSLFCFLFPLCLMQCMNVCTSVGTQVRIQMYVHV